MSGALPVLTAVTGSWEAALVAGLERVGGPVVVVRRCADLADLLAAAASGQGKAAVLSADLRSLGSDALARLGLAGVAVVALVEPGDDGALRRLHQLGVEQVLPADAPAEQVAAAVQAAAAALAQPAEPGSGSDPTADPTGRATPGSSHATAYGDPRRSLAPGQQPAPRPRSGPGSGAAARSTSEVGSASAAGSRSAVGSGPASEGEPLADSAAAARGRLVAVWGPAGAPGRTTTALGLAAEVAASGSSCLLVDADTYAGSVAQLLGLLDEAPGLASAARAADHGTLDVGALSALAPQVTPGLRVLTGLASAARWPEVRPASFATVLEAARGLTACTVVDTSASLEQDEELSYDTAAPRRNGVTLQALQDADVVVAVGSADPVGLQRLVRGLQDLGAVVSSSPVVVVNRVRASAVGPGPERAVRRALARYAGVDDPVLVPHDGLALDAAVLQGRTLPEVAASSAVRAAHLRLARRVGVVRTSPGRADGARHGWREGSNVRRRASREPARQRDPARDATGLAAGSVAAARAAVRAALLGVRGRRTG